MQRIGNWRALIACHASCRAVPVGMYLIDAASVMAFQYCISVCTQSLIFFWFQIKGAKDKYKNVVAKEAEYHQKKNAAR